MVLFTVEDLYKEKLYNLFNVILRVRRKLFITLIVYAVPVDKLCIYFYFENPKKI